MRNQLSRKVESGRSTLSLFVSVSKRKKKIFQRAKKETLLDKSLSLSRNLASSQECWLKSFNAIKSRVYQCLRLTQTQAHNNNNKQSFGGWLVGFVAMVVGCSPKGFRARVDFAKDNSTNAIFCIRPSVRPSPPTTSFSPSFVLIPSKHCCCYCYCYCLSFYLTQETGDCDCSVPPSAPPIHTHTYTLSLASCRHCGKEVKNAIPNALLGSDCTVPNLSPPTNDRCGGIMPSFWSCTDWSVSG